MIGVRGTPSRPACSLPTPPLRTLTRKEEEQGLGICSSWFSTYCKTRGDFIFFTIWHSHGR